MKNFTYIIPSCFIVAVLTLFLNTPSYGLPACSPGEYYDTFLTSCEPCDVGRYNPTGAGTSCLACDPGKFQNQTGQISCLLCEAGTFADLTESQSCTTCPAGKTSDIGATSCYDRPSGKRSSVTGNFFKKGENQTENEETTNEQDDEETEDKNDGLSPSVKEKVQMIATRFENILEKSSTTDIRQKLLGILEARLEMYTKNQNEHMMKIISYLLELLKESE